MRYAHALLSQGYVFVLRKVWEAGSGRAEWKAARLAVEGAQTQGMFST